MGGSRDRAADDRWQTVVWYLPNYSAAPRAALAFHYPNSLLEGCGHKFTPHVLVSVKLSKSANAGTNWECQAGLGTLEQTLSCGLCQLPAFIIVMACQTGLGNRRGGREEEGPALHCQAIHSCSSCHHCTSRATFILFYLLTNYVSPKSHLQPSPTQMAINHSSETKRVLQDI